jgi:hypothetical protein
MNVVRYAFGHLTNLVHLFVTIVIFIRRVNHFDSHLRLCHRAFHKPKESKTNLAFCSVFDPDALPNVSKASACEIVVTISGDLPGEVRQSGGGMGERDIR